MNDANIQLDNICVCGKATIHPIFLRETPST